MEIHAIKPSDKTQRHEQRRNHGQGLHHLVAAQTDLREVKVPQICAEFAIGFNDVHELDSVVITVTKIRARDVRN